MNLEIKCVSADGIGKLGFRKLKKLRREAIKTKINPSFDSSRKDITYLTQCKLYGDQKKINLNIKYNPPANAVKVYGDLHNCEPPRAKSTWHL